LPYTEARSVTLLSALRHEHAINGAKNDW